MTNTNSKTGIRFGVIQGNSAMNLMEDIFSNGTDNSYEYYKNDLIKKIVGSLNDSETIEELAKNINGDIDAYSDRDLEDITEIAKDAFEEMKEEENLNSDDIKAIAVSIVEELMNQDIIQYENDEANHSYEDSDGNQFEMTYLGGAPLIYCIKTNKIVHCKRLCSPCVPNAGDLDSGLTTESEGYECYGVPDDYVESEEV